MTWDAFHRRGTVLRTVVAEADHRRDGVLPLDAPGVADAVPAVFPDETALVAALQLRWHTRLAGRLEQALADDSTDTEAAVLAGWRATARELAGVRLVLDGYDEPLARARDKEWRLLAAMAGLGAAGDPRAPRLGEDLERRARASYDPQDRSGTDARGGPTPATSTGGGLVGRLRHRLGAHRLVHRAA